MSELVQTVKVKKLVIDNHDLNIGTKYGSYYFWANTVRVMPRHEAEELIKVRTEQRRQTRRPDCDLVIVEDD